MKKEIKLLTLSALFTFVLLITSGFFSGVFHTIVYILSFLAPGFVCLALYCSGKKDEKIFSSDYLKIGKREALLASGFIFPTVLLVFSVSFVTSLVMTALGRENTTVITETPFVAILLHALLPAALEEIAFRYFPMRIMGNKDPRRTVFVSASLFALVHHSFFSIPYAFVAGVAFMAIDLTCRSVYPSFIIHFVNNVASLFVMGALGIQTEIYVAFILLVALSLVSFVLLWVRRKELAEGIKAVFTKGEGALFPIELLYVFLPSILIAVSEVWV